jgi:hypothetical protein
MHGFALSLSLSLLSRDEVRVVAAVACEGALGFEGRARHIGLEVHLAVVHERVVPEPIPVGHLRSTSKLRASSKEAEKDGWLTRQNGKKLKRFSFCFYEGQAFSKTKRAGENEAALSSLRSHGEARHFSSPTSPASSFF